MALLYTLRLRLRLVGRPFLLLLAGSGLALASRAQTPPAPAAFHYVPAAPVKGKLKGVVELGADGFNSFIVRVDAQRRWKLEKAEFGKSFIMSNMATDADIKQGVKAYTDKMTAYGVSRHDQYVVVSSGAAQAQVTARLVQALKAAGYAVTLATPAREGAADLAAALPAAYADKSFVVDMGSGNTKISWLAHGKATTVATYGSKFFEGKFAKPATVLAAVRAQARQVPAGQRQRCFVLGGVPYELAQAAHPAPGRYAVLLPAASYPAPQDAKVKAGLAIYQALAEATGCQSFVFDTKANFAIGYLLTTP